VHLLDGSYIATNGIYSDFCKLVKELANQYPLLCSEEEYNNDVSATGSCGKFVFNEEDKTLRLPMITTFIQGLSDLTTIGKAMEAGLPNITGSVGQNYNQTSVNGGWHNYQNAGGGGQGALYLSGTENGSSCTWSTYGDAGSIAFDASLSNSIYSKSDTVQPPAIKYPYYIVLATVKQTDIEVNIDNITNDLNQLSNQVINIENSLLNKIKRYVTETWVSSDGLTWYTLYNDGWKECGGKYQTVNNSVATITLPVTFKDTSYTVIGSMCDNSGYPIR
jgi:hypothetical protein